jgi:hypothetical protein
VVPDPQPQGERNPWRTYQACLEVGARLKEPFVILQDDCLPVPGFREAAAACRKVLPEALIAFSLQGMVQHGNRTQFWQALDRGEPLMRFHPHNWVPAMALGWTTELANLALEWDQLQTQLRPNFTSDDGRLFHFGRWAGAEVWATVPCLVDHPDDVPAVGELKAKGKPSRRTLQLLEGDARDWLEALPQAAFTSS